MNNGKKLTSFARLKAEDRDLTMFTITNLVLREEPNGNMVYMALKLKRKVARRAWNRIGSDKSSGTTCAA